MIKLADLTKTYIETLEIEDRRLVVKEMAVELADVFAISRKFQHDERLQYISSSDYPIHGYNNLWLSKLEYNLERDVGRYTDNLKLVLDDGMRDMDIKGFTWYHRELVRFNTQLVANWLLTDKKIGNKFDSINRYLRSRSQNIKMQTV